MTATKDPAPRDTTSASVRPDSWRATRTAGPRVLRKILSLDDFQEAARRRLPRPIFGYIVSGSETSASIRANRAAYDDLAFLPQVLVDTAERTQKATLFGRHYDSPFGISPMGGNSLAAYQGDLILARAAAQANIPMILSGGALTALEKVREAGPTTWFQAYLPGERGAIEELVDRVARAGYDTLCLTVDMAVASNLEASVRSGFRKPFRPTLRLAWDGITRPGWLFSVFARTLLFHGIPHVENLATTRSPIFALGGDRDRGRLDKLAWPHLEMIRRQWQGNLVVKGILNRKDARIARESGVDGIIVSNHGGRQLDGSIPPLRVLPAIASEAAGMTVMVDSGIRRGTDVLKALGLGAQFVFIGRPMLYAAAIAGAAGVHHAIDLLRDEIQRDMALLGITTLAEMTRERLMDARGFEGVALQS